MLLANRRLLTFSFLKISFKIASLCFRAWNRRDWSYQRTKINTCDIPGHSVPSVSSPRTCDTLWGNLSDGKFSSTGDAWEILNQIYCTLCVRRLLKNLLSLEQIPPRKVKHRQQRLGFVPAKPHLHHSKGEKLPHSCYCPEPTSAISLCFAGNFWWVIWGLFTSNSVIKSARLSLLPVPAPSPQHINYFTFSKSQSQRVDHKAREKQ